MRKVVYLVASSLDGSIACADGSFDCFVQYGEHVDEYLQALKYFDAVLMGRKTYEVGLSVGVTNPYPAMKSYVFSWTLRESHDAAVQVVSGDAASFVKKLKQESGRNIYLCGGGELASQLIAAKLIDEIVVKLNPLLIGSGIPMFAQIGRPIELELIASKTYRNGVLLLTYRVRY